ncbi:MAG: Holliday junction branch migration protein RuvA [Spirochaetia bacterium]|nr:Holliday junction branch migration protein RuvA [Spirochaetia bacterium]
MIYSIKGKIISLSPFFAIIESGGVGYGLHIPIEVHDKLSKENQKEILLYTRFIQNETEQHLFGFLKEVEVKLFDFLRNLQGIGPKMALNLMSTGGSYNLINMLILEQKEALLKIPGIGKLKAEKILFESKQKIKKLESLKQSIAAEDISGDVSPQASLETSFENQIEEALVSLGFQKKEIENAKNKILRLDKTKLPAEEKGVLQEWVRLYLSLI